MNELALFAGAGGGILGGHLLGWRTVCAVEWEPYAACVLAARQNDKILPPFPIWDDVQTFDGKPWRGIVDVISGGFPCQDISAAGKGAGIDGERSGMWKEMARIIGEVRPRFVFVENSPMLTSRGLGSVLGDLATLGYDTEWGVISAADTGAPHLRERIWVVGYTNNNGQATSEVGRSIIERSDSSKTRQIKTRKSPRSSEQYAKLADSAQQRLQGWKNHSSKQGVEAGTSNAWSKSDYGRFDWWLSEPNVGRVANGVAARVDRLKAIGNGQVPRVAATAFELLRERLNES